MEIYSLKIRQNSPNKKDFIEELDIHNILPTWNQLTSADDLVLRARRKKLVRYCVNPDVS